MSLVTKASLQRFFAGLKGKFAPISHKHTKSQITDFPSSMPASDVSAWAKAASKPSYTKAEVGLGNVDNTADSAKSVKYATSAGSAGSAGSATNDSKKQAITGYIRGLSVSGRTVTYTRGDGTTGSITTQDTNTTYGNATTSSSGLMSSSDKSKLDGIASGANKTVVDSTISQSSTNPVQNGVITKRLQFLYSFKISRDKWNESSDKSNWNVIVSWTNSSGTALTGSTTGTPNLTTDMSLGPAMMERTSSLSDNVILSGELSMINQGQIYVCDTNKLSFTVKRRPVCDLMLYFYARKWTT
uniref:Uncharacterized protein n=1 Tax=Siphoviridae sp. ct96x5 TaxID=2825367 RepID=A0A8S5PSP4_9CAUD|nr:MAG TPA: hypothetical protein [Siphoviridae sp. ct96x5]